MEFEEMIAQARDAVSVRRVYGEPYERDGVTVIPAASIRGGSGGGGGEGEVEGELEGEAGGKREGAGGGAGFGLVGRPVGAYVIENGQVSWRPAIDLTGIVLRFGFLTAFVVLVLGVVERLRR